MTSFDKRIKELSQNVEIPKGYSKRVEDVLDAIQEEDEEPHREHLWIRSKKFAVAFCLICVTCFVHIFGMKANANIFETFRLTIMDILNIGGEEEKKELGVDSQKEIIESKPDLMIETQEIIVDTNGIYLLIKITAPTDIAFDDKILFYYFCFCEGENYVAENIIGGVRDCYLVEIMREKPNVATYMMTLTADMTPYEDTFITAYFKDLAIDPYGENPEVLVEGMWSVTFMTELTVRENIAVQGSADMTFPYADTTVALEKIEMTALGMTVTSDISNVPADVLGILNECISVRVKMTDGSEINIAPYNPDKEYIVEGGSVEVSEIEGKTYQKDIYSFSEAVDITKVIGFYIQDMFVPISMYEK